MTKKEKFEKALEWLENAEYNCENIEKTGAIALAVVVKDQIHNAIRALNDEDISDTLGGTL